MDIGEKNTANLKDMEVAVGNISGLERQKICTDILTFCGQGTGGMIDILKTLQELAQ